MANPSKCQGSHGTARGPPANTGQTLFTTTHQRRMPTKDPKFKPTAQHGTGGQRTPKRSPPPHENQPSNASHGGGGLKNTQCMTPRQVCPRPKKWLRAQLAFKNSMTREILQFTPSIAFRCVLHRYESRDIHCRESFYHQHFHMSPHRIPCMLHARARG